MCHIFVEAQSFDHCIIYAHFVNNCLRIDYSINLSTQISECFQIFYVFDDLSSNVFKFG